MNRLIFLLLITLLSAGCQTLPPEVVANRKAKTLTPEQLVTERAKARWDALIAGDIEKSYTYLSEGYRIGMPLASYSAKRSQDPFKIISVYIREVNCQDVEVCNVSIALTIEATMQTVGKKQFPSILDEAWLKQGDSWFHVPK